MSATPAAPRERRGWRAARIRYELIEKSKTRRSDCLDAFTIEISGSLDLHPPRRGEAEREIGQRLLFDMPWRCGECDATLTDRIEDTVNYGEVCQHVAFVAQERSYPTLERLCSEVADRLLDPSAPGGQRRRSEAGAADPAAGGGRRGRGSARAGAIERNRPVIGSICGGYAGRFRGSPPAYRRPRPGRSTGRPRRPSWPRSSAGHALHGVAELLDRGGLGGGRSPAARPAPDGCRGRLRSSQTGGVGEPGIGPDGSLPRMGHPLSRQSSLRFHASQRRHRLRQRPDRQRWPPPWRSDRSRAHPRPRGSRPGRQLPERVEAAPTPPPRGRRPRAP